MLLCYSAGVAAKKKDCGVSAPGGDESGGNRKLADGSTDVPLHYQKVDYLIFCVA